MKDDSESLDHILRNLKMTGQTEAYKQTLQLGSKAVRKEKQRYLQRMDAYSASQQDDTRRTLYEDYKKAENDDKKLFSSCSQSILPTNSLSPYPSQQDLASSKKGFQKFVSSRNKSPKEVLIL